MALGDILDAKEVAQLLGCSVTAVHRLAYRGTLSSEWLHGKRVWRRSVVDRYLADAEAQARRRSGSGQGKLFLGDTETSLDVVLGSIRAQAPASFDPVGRRRGGAK